MTPTVKLAARLELAVVTATNDDLSEPMTEKRARHVERTEVMREAAATLRTSADRAITGPSEAEIAQVLFDTLSRLGVLDQEIFDPMRECRHVARAVLALLAQSTTEPTYVMPADGERR